MSRRGDARAEPGDGPDGAEVPEAGDPVPEASVEDAGSAQRAPGRTAAEAPELDRTGEDGGPADDALEGGEPEDGPTSGAGRWWWPAEPVERLEVGLSLALVAVSTVYVVRFVAFALTTSLWTDELAALNAFTRQGLGPTLTTYDANNHILFDVLNALTPNAGSHDPARARMWSIVALVLFLGWGLYEFARRRWYLAGAVLYFLFGVNFTWLLLVTQARGYGVLATCALGTTLVLWRFLDDGRTRWLVGLSVLTFLGTWTVPTFLFFAAPMWFVLLVMVRKWRVLWCGAVAVVAIGAGYAAVAGQVAEVNADYAERFGKSFVGVKAVVGTAEHVFDQDRARYVAAALFAVLLVAAVLPPVRGLEIPLSVRRLCRIVVVGGAATFGLSLLIQTPVPRTVAFAMVPLCVAALAASATLLAGRRVPARARMGIILVVAVLATLQAGKSARGLTLLPIEDWRSAAEYVDSSLPTTIGVIAGTRTPLVAEYLDPGRVAQIKVDEKAFLDGRAAIVYEAHTKSVKGDIPKLTAKAARMDIPQLRGYRLNIYVMPPKRSGTGTVTVDGEDRSEFLADRDVRTGVSFEVDRDDTAPAHLDAVVDEGLAVRSVSVATDADHAIPKQIDVTLVLPDGSRELVGPDRITWSQSMMTVAVGDRELDRVEMTLHRTTARRPLAIGEVWVSPAG